MNYNELFNVFYSNLPESVKISILENLPEEALLEGLNESVDTYRPILEVLDILAYSEDITEEKANAVIDEIFSNIDEQVAEEILEAYSKEKFIQYIEEALINETDAIGLAGIRRENAERDKQAQRVQARKQAISNAIGNTITKAREAKDKAVTGAREATEKAISKGAELKAKAISKGAELKDKAVIGIKNAVGKVKDWAKKATEPSAKDYASAIGKKASDNELKIKPGSYADRYAKAMNKYQQKYGEVKPATDKKAEPEKVSTNPIKASADNTKVAKEVEANKPEVKPAEEKKPEVNKVENKPASKKKNKVKNIKKAEAEQQKLNLEQPKIEKENKVENIKKVEAKKEEEVKSTPKKKNKVKNIKKAENKSAEAKKEEKVEASKPANTEAKKEQEVENKPVEAKKEESKSKKQLSSLERIYKKHDMEKRQQAEERNKNLQRDYDLLGKEIEAMEGKPSMLAQKQEKMKKRAELQKKLQELQTVKANEALTDLAYLLAHTNISESLFVEVMEKANPVSIRKAKFTSIASKLNN